MEDQQSDSDDLIGTRRFRRRLTVVVGVAATLFVIATAAFAAALQPHLADRAAAANRIEVTRTAAAAVTALWTYNPDTVDTLADRAAEYLGGDFDAEYRKFVAAAISPNKHAQITDSTEVVGVGVQSLHGQDAVVVVFTNTTATSPLTQNIPSLKFVAYRLAMQREGSRWLVTKMSTISFMDLTPTL